MRILARLAMRAQRLRQQMIGERAPIGGAAVNVVLGIEVGLGGLAGTPRSTRRSAACPRARLRPGSGAPACRRPRTPRCARWWRHLRAGRETAPIPASAKSPRRRENSSNAHRRPAGQAGRCRPVTSSSGSSTVVSGPVKNERAGTCRAPAGPEHLDRRRRTAPRRRAARRPGRRGRGCRRPFRGCGSGDAPRA